MLRRGVAAAGCGADKGLLQTRCLNNPLSLYAAQLIALRAGLSPTQKTFQPQGRCGGKHTPHPAFPSRSVFVVGRPVCQKTLQAPSGSPLSGHITPHSSLQPCCRGSSMTRMSFFILLPPSAGRSFVGCEARNKITGRCCHSATSSAWMGSCACCASPCGFSLLINDT